MADAELKAVLARRRSRDGTTESVTAELPNESASPTAGGLGDAGRRKSGQVQNLRNLFEELGRNDNAATCSSSLKSPPDSTSPRHIRKATSQPCGPRQNAPSFESEVSSPEEMGREGVNSGLHNVTKKDEIRTVDKRNEPNAQSVHSTPVEMPNAGRPATKTAPLSAKAARRLSEASQEIMANLSSYERQMLECNALLERMERDTLTLEQVRESARPETLNSQTELIARMKGELAQLLGHLTKIQSEGIDSILVSHIISGQEEARKYRKQLNALVEDMICRTQDAARRVSRLLEICRQRTAVEESEGKHDVETASMAPASKPSGSPTAADSSISGDDLGPSTVMDLPDVEQWSSPRF